MRKRRRNKISYDLNVEERVRFYKLMLYSQIIGTILMIIGFVFFLLLLAGLIHY